MTVDPNQGALFPDPESVEVPSHPRELVLSGHPETSRLGAEAVMPHVGALQQKTLDAVKQHPVCTVSELAQLFDLRDPRQFGRRLNELKRKGLVRAAGIRICRVTGCRATIWRATGHGGD